jgi:hypothetical protein
LPTLRPPNRRHSAMRALAVVGAASIVFGVAAVVTAAMIAARRAAVETGWTFDV